jgi:2-polyprenyl-3-methyl-5-hydroxy-6-metoxy-1,4-benzoquinol methylase
MEFTFDDFKERAKNNSLSKWEKIGFPDSYRKNSELEIFNDILSKLKLENSESILDIGCGCSDLVEHLIQYSKSTKKKLFLVDSEEMLANIDSSLISDEIFLINGNFPETSVIKKISNTKFDSIIVYSVLQYIFIEQSMFKFIHKCVNLLKPGGGLLLGDIPNFQSRERFLESADGLEFRNNQSNIQNPISLKHENEERIDDSIIMSILLRFRQFGCETYLLPQSEALPFSNRREDILIIKR